MISPSQTSAPDPAMTSLSVLVVDDSPVDRHLAGGIVEKMGGWKVSYACNGVDAMEQMRKQLPDVVLTDMLMPEMDGLELVQAIRTSYPTIPVILMTAHGSEEIAIQALKRGAASYVPKKTLAQYLGETLEQVVSSAQARSSQQRVLSCLTGMEAHFELTNDTSLIAPLISFLEESIARVQLCEPSGLILLGVSLHEALTNAIFHGNLEVSSALKEEDEKAYYRLAEERRQQEPYRSRMVRVSVKLSPREGSFIVKDDGDGFDPAQLPDPTDPANLERVSGRGLLLIHTFMDRVEHNPSGNQITMIKYRAS